VTKCVLLNGSVHLGKNQHGSDKNQPGVKKTYYNFSHIHSIFCFILISRRRYCMANQCTFFVLTSILPGTSGQSSWSWYTLIGLLDSSFAWFATSTSVLITLDIMLSLIVNCLYNMHDWSDISLAKMVLIKASHFFYSNISLNKFQYQSI
jgi:hypothetical protein